METTILQTSESFGDPVAYGYESWTHLTWLNKMLKLGINPCHQPILKILYSSYSRINCSSNLHHASVWLGSASSCQISSYELLWQTWLNVLALHWLIAGQHMGYMWVYYIQGVFFHYHNHHHMTTTTRDNHYHVTTTTTDNHQQPPPPGPLSTWQPPPAIIDP